MRTPRPEIFLKAFLDECGEEKKEALLQFLPEEERLRLLKLPPYALPITAPTIPPLDLIHWSWLIPVLQDYELSDQKLFLLALRPKMGQRLAKELEITLPTEHLSPTGVKYLQNILFLNICKTDLLPVEYLPPSPLNLLLKLSKKKLIELIDLLSLYDLAIELRQIVETKILQKIYSFLSEEEKLFLKAIAGHKEPYPAARISLEQWDGSKKSLRGALHRIGLSRLGSALAGQNPDLIWYVCHELDSGRGKALEKLSMQEECPQVAQWLIEKMKEFL
jgi:hypothetical protein